MLLTNQKIINYEIYIYSGKETTPYLFNNAKIINKKSVYKQKIKFNITCVNTPVKYWLFFHIV